MKWHTQAMQLRIKDLRKERGWTIEQLGQMVGLSRGFLSEVENGKKNLSTPMMEAVAAAFEVGVTELFDAGEIAADLAIIAEHFREMTPEERRQAVRIVASMRDPAEQ